MMVGEWITKHGAYSIQDEMKMMYIDVYYTSRNDD
jgi:hypothetical protein